MIIILQHTPMDDECAPSGRYRNDERSIFSRPRKMASVVFAAVQQPKREVEKKTPNEIRLEQKNERAILWDI